MHGFLRFLALCSFLFLVPAFAAPLTLENLVGTELLSCARVGPVLRNCSFPDGVVVPEARVGAVLVERRFSGTYAFVCRGDSVRVGLRTPGGAFDFARDGSAFELVGTSLRFHAERALLQGARFLPGCSLRILSFSMDLSDGARAFLDQQLGLMQAYERAFAQAASLARSAASLNAALSALDLGTMKTLLTSLRENVTLLEKSAGEGSQIVWDEVYLLIDEAVNANPAVDPESGVHERVQTALAQIVTASDTLAQEIAASEAELYVRAMGLLAYAGEATRARFRAANDPNRNVFEDIHAAFARRGGQ